MSKYTAEDFESAQFAKHPARVSASRDSGDPDLPWRTEVGCRSDEDLARSGFAPVREGRPPDPRRHH